MPPAFREVFGLFDVNGGGTIDAQELHSTLCSVDIHLSHDEIEDVLCVMDEDGTFCLANAYTVGLLHKWFLQEMAKLILRSFWH